MQKKGLMLATLLGLMLFFSLGLADDFEAGKNYHGFKLLKKQFVAEVNSQCLYFEHVKAGARLLKIAADDANKTFSIAFKTLPESDCGTPHIMEHSVLNGSENFPVKSPFDVLSKGSLHTFLNAMTGGDLTIYPVASMNDKDYFNLMHVYLDAVFNPLIYSDPRIFKQEGWHYELTDKESPIVYKGVVYNEMKGAFSNPTRELYYQINKHLFPDNSYGYSSGGTPTAIPQLTYERFLDFHRRYYHPSNSYIFLYGDGDLNKELAFIDQEYLSHYEKAAINTKIPLQKPFSQMKTVTEYYAAPQGHDIQNQTYLSLNIVAGVNTDRALYMALDALSDILVNHEAGPVRLALQKAGIGKEVRAGVDDIKQPLFQIIVQNANPDDQAKFQQIIFETLEECVGQGLDKDMVHGVINRMEFNLREGDDAQKGLKYNFEALSGWLFADDPFLSLAYEKPLSKLKTALTSDYLEEIISKYLLNNPHTLRLALEPKPGLEKENNARLKDQLTAYKETLSDSELDSLIQETKALIAYQQREDSPEALASIPLLKLSDINPQADFYQVKSDKVAWTPIMQFETFTNDVIYVKLYFDMRVLPQELIPYAALLSEILGSLNTENYGYGELDNALNIYTGGFNVNLATYLENQNDVQMIPKFVVSSKAMPENLDKLFELTAEVILHSQYDDPERLKAVLMRHASRKEAHVKGMGYYYALTRLFSYFRSEGMFNELTNGLDYYWFINNLSENFDSLTAEVSTQLAKTAQLLFARKNMLAAVTCQSQNQALFRKEFKGFVRNLPRRRSAYQDWQFKLQKKNEGLLAASKVQYVMQGYDFKKLGYTWNGKMRVMDQVVQSDYLHTQLRVIGGAYGGYCGFSPDGIAYFMSYRDPNLTETLDNYAAVPDYLHDLQIDEKLMTRYIIGTIANMDRPLTPSQKGNQAVKYHLEKTSHSQLQQERDAVLNTTSADIRQMESMIKSILAQKAICVYGNEQKLQEHQDIFNKLIPVMQ